MERSVRTILKLSPFGYINGYITARVIAMVVQPHQCSPREHHNPKYFEHLGPSRRRLHGRGRRKECQFSNICLSHSSPCRSSSRTRTLPPALHVCVRFFDETDYSSCSDGTTASSISIIIISIISIPQKPIKIYHVPGTRSIRVIWVCEELGVNYEKVTISFSKEYRSSPEWRALNPGAVSLFYHFSPHECILLLVFLVGR